MLTERQRVVFFKLARSAYSSAAPGVAFDVWRAETMRSHGFHVSTKEMDHVWEFEEAALVLAEMAGDVGQMTWYMEATKRRLMWIFNGLAKDFEYLKEHAVGVEYASGIVDNARITLGGYVDAETMRRTIGLVDSAVRKMAKAQGVPLSHLPTAGRPWCFRGARAAAYAKFLVGKRGAA